MKDPLIENIIKRMRKRSAMGIKHYGVTMRDAKKPVKSWIEDAQEELMDSIIYLEKIKEQL